MDGEISTRGRIAVLESELDDLEALIDAESSRLHTSWYVVLLSVVGVFPVLVAVLLSMIGVEISVALATAAVLPGLAAVQLLRSRRRKRELLQQSAALEDEIHSVRAAIDV